MLSVNFKWLCILISVFFLSACNEDLIPSDKDERLSVEEGSIGNQVGQIAADFTAQDSLENEIVLSDELASNDAVVIYFTMWCPLCDSHMTSMRQNVKPQFPSVRFLMVDYVTGSIAQSRAGQLSNGYASETIISDIGRPLFEQFDGNMAVTIVIDSSGEIVMNESYKQSKLLSVLNLALQP